jgi:ribonuclease P/MRP protein subunit RPP1
MYYDVNISTAFPQAELCVLEENGYDGCCINTAIAASQFKNQRLQASGTTNLARIEVEFKQDELISYDEKKALKCDLFVVKLSGLGGMDRLIKAAPDMISFNYVDELLVFRHGLIRTAIKEKIFFEVPLIEGVHGNPMWMKNVRRLLNITRGRNTVVSSGATCPTEIKRPRDIAQMLRVFGLSKKRARAVLMNSERLLSRCAMKRYACNGCIVHGGEEGMLKKVFLLDRLRRASVL